MFSAQFCFYLSGKKANAVDELGLWKQNYAPRVARARWQIAGRMMGRISTTLDFWSKVTYLSKGEVDQTTGQFVQHVIGAGAKRERDEFERD